LKIGWFRGERRYEVGVKGEKGLEAREEIREGKLVEVREEIRKGEEERMV
jgi:hypothetical protein